MTPGCWWGQGSVRKQIRARSSPTPNTPLAKRHNGLHTHMHVLFKLHNYTPRSALTFMFIMSDNYVTFVFVYIQNIGEDFTQIAELCATGCIDDVNSYFEDCPAAIANFGGEETAQGLAVGKL